MNTQLHLVVAAAMLSRLANGVPKSCCCVLHAHKHGARQLA